VGLYTRFLQHVLLPVGSFARGRSYHRLSKFLEQSQWWPPERLREFQWKELQKLLTIAFESVPFYQRKYAAAGARLEDIRSWEDFQHLPVLTREEVNQHREELFPSSLTAEKLPHATGGSTGVPVRFYRTWESYDWRLAATHRAYSWSGHRPGERTLYLWAAPLPSRSRWADLKTRLQALLERRLTVPTWLQNETLWQQAYQNARSFRPRYLVGYVSSLLGFARYLENRRLPIPSLRAVITAAEPLPPTVRRYLGDVFGAPVFETYGSREFMSIGAECERHEGLHLNVENLVVEAAVAPDQPSDILITDLHNLGTVFIRYVIGDAGKLAAHSCSCGRGLPLLESVDGRTADRIKLSGGRTVSGLFFVHLLKELPEILQYQVRQESPDRVLVLLVLSRELSAPSRSLLDSELRRVLGNTEIVIRRVSEIPVGPTGKHQPVIGLHSASRSETLARDQLE
jgi:phenylacetate-CoA ligase